MPMIYVLKVMLIALICTPAVLAQTAPHLDGQVMVDLTEGILYGDVCLSRLPSQQTYSFLLNRGLNVREVRDASSGHALDFEGYYNATNVGDATRYTITDSTGTRGFCVSYIGAFPVYDVEKGEFSVNDWKGQITFNGRTVRATEQARFHPAIEDSVSGAALEKVSYRLEISCKDCTALYVNGSTPTTGPQATFVSDLPRPLFLFAGTFQYKTLEGVHFMGADVSAVDAELVQAGIQMIVKSHEAYLGVPYEDEPAFLTFAAVSRARQLGRSSWAFVTWPTLAMDGRVPFSNLIDSSGKSRNFSPDKIAWMSHEMSHYYFGTLYSPRGPLKWFLLESVAEFMSLKALKVLRGDSTYSTLLRSHYQNAVAGGLVVPLNRVREAQWIGGNYRYHLGPLLLVALESYVGEEVVKEMLASLVMDPPTAEVDYTEFRKRLRLSGATEESLSSFEMACLVQNVEEGCLAELRQLQTDSISTY